MGRGRDVCTYALCMRGRVTHTSGRVTRPPSGHEFRKRSLARDKEEIGGVYSSVAHRGERERRIFLYGEIYIFIFRDRTQERMIGKNCGWNRVSRPSSRLRPLNIVEKGVRARVGSRLASFVPRPQRKLSFKPKTGLNIL